MKKIIALCILALLFLTVGCTKRSTVRKDNKSSNSETSQNNKTITKEVQNKTQTSNNTQTPTELPDVFDLRFKDPAPNVEPFKDFDCMEAIEVFEGATYTFSGTYIGSRNKEFQIEFDGSVMNIPQDGTCAELTVNATYDGNTITKEISLGVNGIADVMDSGLMGCWNEDSISETLNYNPKYIKEGNTSIKFSFGGYFFYDGIQFCNINGHLANDDEIGIYDYSYLSIYKEENVEEAYKDAYLIFWIYNAMTDSQAGDYKDKITIGCRIKESPSSGVEHPVNTDFRENPRIECNRNEWTLVVFPLKEMGKTTDFYKNMDIYYLPNLTDEEFRNSYDALVLKVKGENLPKAGDSYDPEVKYLFTFYLDGYDILSRAQMEAAHPEYFNND